MTDWMNPSSAAAIAPRRPSPRSASRAVLRAAIARQALEARHRAVQGRAVGVVAGGNVRAIAAVVVEVALRLDQHAAFVSGELAYRDVVGKRSGRHEHRRLLAEPFGEGLFDFLDDAAIRIEVGREGARRRGFVQERRVFARVQSKPIGTEVDALEHVHARRRRSRGSAGRAASTTPA